MLTPDFRPVGRATPRVVLASASPARLTLLRNAGLEPEVVVSGLDESRFGESTARALTARLAREKARLVASRAGSAPALVIGCDSVLAFDGEILGKPDSPAEAVRRWRRMRNSSGVLVTGHCVIDTARDQEEAAVAETTVHFADPSDAEIEAYVATGEPTQVAGSFTIDGLGGPFVDGLAGDWSNVVGLSLPTLRRLLAALDVRMVDLWTSQPNSVEPQ